MMVSVVVMVVAVVVAVAAFPVVMSGGNVGASVHGCHRGSPCDSTVFFSQAYPAFLNHLEVVFLLKII